MSQLQLSSELAFSLLVTSFILALAAVLFKVRIAFKSSSKPRSVSATVRHLAAVAAVLALTLLAAVIVLAVSPALFRDPPETETLAWKQRYDNAQNDLQAARERIRALQADLR